MTERDFDYDLKASLAEDKIDEMRAELAQLRAELERLKPLAEAAVAEPVDRLGDAVDHLIEVRQWLIDQGRKDIAASIWFAIEWTSGAKREWDARAQAQDGAA